MSEGGREMNTDSAVGAGVSAAAILVFPLTSSQPSVAPSAIFDPVSGWGSEAFTASGRHTPFCLVNRATFPPSRTTHLNPPHLHPPELHIFTSTLHTSRTTPLRASEEMYLFSFMHRFFQRPRCLHVY